MALLPLSGTHLIGRANATAAGGKTLFASGEVTGLRHFSGSWVSGHDIKAREGRPLAGAFMLRALLN